MNIYDAIEEMKTTCELTQETAVADFCRIESELAKLFSEYVKDATVESTAYGVGNITEVRGDSLETMIATIAFKESTKSFSLHHIITNPKAVKLVDSEIIENYNKAFDLHTELAIKYREFEKVARQLAFEARQKAEAEKKAEEKYQALKAKAIKDFDTLANQTKGSLSTVDDFYYSLGWLAKHVGTISAAMPDYLVKSFENYFGTEANPKVIDSKKRTSGGHPMQWALSMTASLCGKDKDSIPRSLAKYLNTTGKAIANTSFVWDLVDNYGFQFGKKQDIDRIKNIVPTQYISDFEAGLTA